MTELKTALKRCGHCGCRLPEAQMKKEKGLIHDGWFGGGLILAVTSWHCSECDIADPEGLVELWKGEWGLLLVCAPGERLSAWIRSKLRSIGVLVLVADSGFNGFDCCSASESQADRRGVSVRGDVP